MQVHQVLSILFYRKKKKMDKSGFIPIYCRITIDGLKEEISTGYKVQFDDWDPDTKTIKNLHPDHKAINKKLGQMETDLQRHFDLVVAKSGLATPKQVFASYKIPMNGYKQRVEKQEIAAFSLSLDELIKNVIRYFRKLETLEKKGPIPPSQLLILREQKREQTEQMEKLSIRGRKIWDNKEWTKTLVTAIDEFLFQFLELLMAGERARITFSKLVTTKARLLEFILKRYQKEDLLLTSIEESFIKDYTKYIIVHL